MLVWYYVMVLYILQKFECFAFAIFCFLSTHISSRLFLPNRIGLISLGTLVSVSCYITFSPSRRGEETDGNADTSTVHRKSRITSIFHHLGKKKRRQFWQIHIGSLSRVTFIFTPSKPGRRGHFWQLLLYIGSTFRKSFDSISQEASLTFFKMI